MFVTTLILALREIRRHVLRSFLTTLGIIIGVSAVVTMVTLGNGATASISAQISSLGTNLLMIRPGQGFGRGGGGPPPQPFKLSDVEAIRTQIGGVHAVAPQNSIPAVAIYESQNWSTTVLGSTNDYFISSNFKLESGRFFIEPEVEAGKSVCVIGTTVKTNLFNDVDPIGKSFRLKDISCEAVGVLASRGKGGIGADQDDQVIMPIKTVMRRMTGNRDINVIQIAVDAAYDTQAVSAAVAALLRERRKLEQGAPDDFSILDSKQLSDTLAGTTKTLTAFLGAVAAVSLIVGGIGIMNIMLVSVTERTREIGIRLAIGAVQREVLMQFLVEAVALSCLGGIIGLLVALILTASISPLMGIPFVIDYQINILAFLFSAAIGIIFGYFPARRAASLNPIDALRHE